jgi:hypothetical protein
VSEPDALHYRLVATRIREGGVIPFLGAGANLADRSETERFAVGRYFPDAGELAAVLAERSEFPAKDDVNLLRVSQYLDAVLGEGVLYDVLREVFRARYPPNSVHRYLASIPALLRAEGLKRKEGSVRPRLVRGEEGRVLRQISASPA